MKRFLFSIGALLLCLSAFAQPYQIPDGYEAEFAAAEEKVRILKAAGFDYVLDPIEQVAIKASVEDLQTGNWANDYLQILEYSGQLSYKRIVAAFIHDTAGELDHQYLKAAHNELGEVFTGEAPRDGHSHGTHVAGCVGASGYSAPLGVAGDMADQNFLWLIPHKCLSNGGSGYHSWIAKSIRRAVEKGKLLQNQGFFIIHVLSLGGSSDNAEVAAAIKEARAAGQMVFVAAGNSGKTPPAFPGRAEGALCTGALQQTASGAARAAYSQYGVQMYMSAPGSFILSTVPGGALKKYSGTSMATPTLAGVAAKLASHYENATAYQIEQMMGLHATPIGSEAWDKFTGWGAPLLKEYLNLKVGDYKDKPLKPGDGNEPPDDDDPEDEDPDRKERDIVVKIQQDIPFVWRRLSDGLFQTTMLRLDIEYTTKLDSEDAYQSINLLTAGYMTNRRFVLLDEHGWIDAPFWFRHFFEMHLKKAGIKATVQEAWAVQDGNKIAYLNAPRRKLASKAKVLFSPIQSFTVGPNLIDRKIAMK